MKRITVAALATALMVGGASVAFSQSGAGSSTPRTESARAADRDDALLGVVGSAPIGWSGWPNGSRPSDQRSGLPCYHDYD